MIDDYRELEELVMKILQGYFKELLFTTRVLPQILAERLCIRLRVPSFKMEVERNAR